MPKLPARAPRAAAAIAAEFSPRGVEGSPIWRSILSAEQAVAAAHRTFLEVAQDSADLIASHAAYELALIEECSRRGAFPESERADFRQQTLERPVRLDRLSCLEFAVGSATVLGPRIR